MARTGNFRGAPRPRTHRWPYPDQGGGQMYSGGGSTPIPDPTRLTQEAVRDGVATVREILEAELDGDLRELLARLNGMDEAVKLIQHWRDTQPAELDAKVHQLERVLGERFNTVDEKFKGVEKQFTERDTRSERESKDNKVAVDAAFAAQKEAASEQNKSNTLAIDKSEKATAETLNKQADLFKSSIDALGDRVESSKEVINKLDTRLTTIESRGIVVREERVQQQGSSTLMIMLAVGLIAAAALIVSIIDLITRAPVVRAVGA